MAAEGALATFSRLAQVISASPSAAVITVVAAEGSVPREAGTKAVVEADGTIHSTVGGGAVEAEAIARAMDACASGEALLVDVDLGGGDASDTTPVCGGSVRLLVQPADAALGETFAQVAGALRERRRGVLLTEISTGQKLIATSRWLPGGTDDALTRFLPDETGEGGKLVEPIRPDPLLVIVGGGHVGQAVAVQGALLGFAVSVIDGRPEFAAPERFPPTVRTRCGDYATELGRLGIDADTYIVILTHGHQHDMEALAACVNSSAAYIGMIGSRRKVALVREALTASGKADGAALDRVHAPVGLDIGAETVAEIATSIAAELVAVRRLG